MWPFPRKKPAGLAEEPVVVEPAPLVTVGAPEPEPVAEPDPCQPGSLYHGRVAYVNGGHYPVPVDEAGVELGPDLDHRLLWIDPEPDNPAETAVGYVFAAPDDPTHEHLYHKRHVDLIEEQPS
jgi:hypothetical protein